MKRFLCMMLCLPFLLLLAACNDETPDSQSPWVQTAAQVLPGMSCDEMQALLGETEHQIFGVDTGYNAYIYEPEDEALTLKVECENDVVTAVTWTGRFDWGDSFYDETAEHCGVRSGEWPGENGYREETALIPDAECLNALLEFDLSYSEIEALLGKPWPRRAADSTIDLYAIFPVGDYQVKVIYLEKDAPWDTLTVRKDGTLRPHSICITGASQ